MTLPNLSSGLVPEQFENDPFQVKKYTLKNGLQVFLSIQPYHPTLSTQIAVRAGSKHDPAETTGLAHYMEHMLFKGTSKIGTSNWEEEKILLEEIAALYEKHRNAGSEDERKEIYQRIDQKSYQAAKLTIPGEYDKLASSIGAKGTNAYTWFEQTVYLNTIPSNELERWIALEAERFSQLTLRLFHTELETVYEEFNISQDMDVRKVSNLLHHALFPGHPYGTQTTIGSAEHLRNPSHYNIHRFFSTYYVPNNMAIILAGDLEPDKTIALIEKYWGTKMTVDIPTFNFDEQPPMKEVIRMEALGQESPFIQMAWRLPGASTETLYLLSLVQHLFYNQQAGLLDLNINQKQLVLESEAWTWFHEDYSAFGFYGKPREGQSLEELEALLLEQLDLLLAGNFPDWLPEAVCNDFRLGELKSLQSNEARTNHITQAFILGIPWKKYASRVSDMVQFSKEDIIHFAKKYLRRDNYAIVYKRKGEDPSVIKVEKPPITAIDINRNGVSDFAKAFLSVASPRLKPIFVSFQDNIKQESLFPGIPIHYVKNPDNELFRLDFIFPLGKMHDPLLPILFKYLPYLGTKALTSSAIQQAFFRLGTSFDVSIEEERCYFSLSGLEKSMEEALILLEKIWHGVIANADILKNVASDIMIKRENARRDRNYLLRNALGSFARYGTQSPFNFQLSTEQLLQLDPEELINRLQTLTQYEHTVYYFGNKDLQSVIPILRKHHIVPTERKSAPNIKSFQQLSHTENKVLFYHFPIVQTDLMWISKGTPTFNLEEHFMKEWYNEYFGYGLSSIVFQEIRESKALAYSTYAFYTSPRKKEEAHYLQAYIGTQPDKIADAIPCLKELLQTMPIVPAQMENARISILKRLESERTTPGGIYWQYRKMLDLGQSEDLRKPFYEHLHAAHEGDLTAFQQQYVKNRNYTLLVMGDKENIDFSILEKSGPVTILTDEMVFSDKPV
jgi:predicted Zn-dependent peptidase